MCTCAHCPTGSLSHMHVCTGRGGGALRLLALAYRDMLVPLQPPPTAAAAAASAPSVAAPATADQARAAGGSRSSSQGVVGGAASMGGRSEMGAAGRGAGSSEGAGEAAATAAAAAKATAVPIDTRSLKLDPEYLEKVGAGESGVRFRGGGGVPGPFPVSGPVVCDW